MDNAENIFGRVFERLQKDILNEKNGDYVNENDGLVYCGVCHSPKQQISNIGGGLRKIPKNCICREKELEKERQHWKESCRI